MSRLHRTVMRELLIDIVAGEPAPGEMLPRELDLAERFEVSRGVVRECVRGLEERGVVRVKHGHGATVTEPLDWDVFDPDVLQALLGSREGDALAEEAVECQRLLEVEAAGLAAERARHGDLADLTAALERMVKAAGTAAGNPAAVDRFNEADLAFHSAVVRAARNRAIGRMSRPLHRALAVIAPRPGDIAALGHAVGQHQRILAAVASRNAAAARAAMAAHLGARSPSRQH